MAALSDRRTSRRRVKELRNIKSRFIKLTMATFSNRGMSQQRMVEMRTGLDLAATRAAEVGDDLRSMVVLDSVNPRSGVLSIVELIEVGLVIVDLRTAAGRTTEHWGRRLVAVVLSMIDLSLAMLKRARLTANILGALGMVGGCGFRGSLVLLTATPRENWWVDPRVPWVDGVK